METQAQRRVLIQAGAELRVVPSLRQGRPRTEGTGNCYTRPARNVALWPYVGLVVLPTAISSRTLRRGASAYFVRNRIPQCSEVILQALGHWSHRCRCYAC